MSRANLEGERSSSRLASLAKVLGLLMVIASLGFLALRVKRSWSSLAVGNLGSPKLVTALIVGATFYAAACFALSEAWHRWLRLFSQRLPPRSVSHQVYARSQIAKYLPGNLFHVAGRHVASRRLGLADSALAAAAVHEIVGLLFGASAMALLGTGVFGVSEANFTLAGLGVVAGATLLAPFLLHSIAARLPGLRRLGLQRLQLVEFLRGLAVAYGLYILFFCAVGCVFLFLVATTGPVMLKSAAALATAFALSWIAGFLTPGAPAGLAVREATIVLALRGLIGEPRSLAVAAIFRMVTLGGDLLYFAGSFWIGRTKPYSTRNSPTL